MIGDDGEAQTPLMNSASSLHSRAAVCSLECVEEDREVVFGIHPSGSPSNKQGFHDLDPEPTSALLAPNLDTPPPRPHIPLPALGRFTPFQQPTQLSESVSQQTPAVNISSPAIRCPATPGAHSVSPPSSNQPLATSSELSLSLTRVSLDTKARAAAASSRFMDASLLSGLTVCTGPSLPSSPSRLHRSASASELYNFPERRVRAGRQQGISASQLADKKIHGGFYASKGDILSTASSISGSTGSPVYGNPVPLRSLKVKSFSQQFAGSSSQLSDTTMDVRHHRDPGCSSARRSSGVCDSLDDGHKAEEGHKVRGGVSEKRVHGGISRGSSRSSNLDTASIAGTASIAIDGPSSARSSITNSLGVGGTFLCGTGSLGRTHPFLSAALADPSFQSLDTTQRQHSNGRHLDDVSWLALSQEPVHMFEKPAPASDALCDHYVSPSVDSPVNGRDFDSAISFAANLSPVLRPSSDSVADTGSTPDLLHTTEAATGASGSPVGAPTRHADGSVSFCSTVACSIVSEPLTVTGLVVEDGSTRLTGSTALAMLSSSAALDLSRSASQDTRSVSESCGVPHVCAIAKTESLGVMYKVRRISCSTLQTADNNSSLHAGGSATLHDMLPVSGSVWGSAFDLPSRLSSNALLGSQDVLLHTRMSIESCPPMLLSATGAGTTGAHSPPTASALLACGSLDGSGIGHYLGNSAACDAEIRQASLFEYAEMRSSSQTAGVLANGSRLHKE